MEAQTAATLSAVATGSRTLADLIVLAAKKHAALPALRYKAGEQWVDGAYDERGAIVKEIALGRASIGIERGDKVGILANTRPEWTHSDFGILCLGATTVPRSEEHTSELQSLA